MIVDDLFGELAIPEEPQRWVVIHTRPRQEKKLANYCKDNGIHYYLPQRVQTRVYNRKKVVTHLPLFSGYLFTILSHQDKETIKLSGSVANFIMVDSQEELMRDLVPIRHAVKIKPDLKEAAWLSEGLFVKVIDGPFKGFEGVVGSHKKLEIVNLQVEMMQRAMSIPVEASHVKIIGEFDINKENK